MHHPLILGLGAVSPAGADRVAFRQALFEVPNAPERQAVPGFPPSGRSWQHGYLARLSASADTRLSRFNQMALSAALEALTDARNRGLDLARLRVGFVIGTAAGQADQAERARACGQQATVQECHAYDTVDQLIEALPVVIDGPAFSISNACAAGLYAIAHAADLMADGHVDAMLVLGVEVLSRVTQAGFQKMTALDPDRCRPFDSVRAGTVLGEGASAVLLVSAAAVRQQGARAYGSVLGAGFSCDAHHPTAPRPDGQGIRDAVRRAMQAANVLAQHIDLVVPHGTGTPLNDRIEGQMLAELLGDRLPTVALMPIKAHIGHCAGASGIFSVVAAAQALASGQTPPTLHLTEQQADPECALALHAQAQSLPAAGGCHALVNAYGFGGNNISMVLQGVLHA